MFEAELASAAVDGPNLGERVAWARARRGRGGDRHHRRLQRVIGGSVRVGAGSRPESEGARSTGPNARARVGTIGHDRVKTVAHLCTVRATRCATYVDHALAL